MTQRIVTIDEIIEFVKETTGSRNVHPDTDIFGDGWVADDLSIKCAKPVSHETRE
jgi:hypothetical protein